jgi:hypothetical protein
MPNYRIIRRKCRLDKGKKKFWSIFVEILDEIALTRINGLKKIKRIL